MMPFGNNLVVMTLTGAQLKAALEQQYAGRRRRQVSGRTRSRVRRVSPTRSTCTGPPAAGSLTCGSTGSPIAPDARYRVVVNNYLASGGDGLSSFTAGTDITDKNIIDLDALVDWIALAGLRRLRTGSVNRPALSVRGEGCSAGSVDRSMRACTDR